MRRAGQARLYEGTCRRAGYARRPLLARIDGEGIVKTFVAGLLCLLLPLAPLYGAIAGPRHPAWRFGMLGLGLLGQWWWIYEMLALVNSYTQIP